MLKTITTVLSLLIGSSSIANAPYTVEFTIKDINANGGKLYIQLFQGKEQFKSGQALRSMIIEANEGDSQVLFSGLSEGDYVIRYFHDENNDGELQTNLFGLPTEGYGFSSNAKANFGPVKYKDAKFAVAGADTLVSTNSVVNY